MSEPVAISWHYYEDTPAGQRVIAKFDHAGLCYQFYHDVPWDAAKNEDGIGRAKSLLRQKVLNKFAALEHETRAPAVVAEEIAVLADAESDRLFDEANARIEKAGPGDEGVGQRIAASFFFDRFARKIRKEYALT